MDLQKVRVTGENMRKSSKDFNYARRIYTTARKTKISNHELSHNADECSKN